MKFQYTYSTKVSVSLTFLRSFVQRAVMSCEFLIGAVEIISHYINKIQIPNRVNGTSNSLKYVLIDDCKM